MQKQVNFFEQHVQWFALGLGGLFLAYMTFSYVMNAPVTVDIGGKVYHPADVDPVTRDGPIAELKREINKPGLPDIPQQDYVQSFLAAIQGSNEQLAQLSPYQTFSPRMHGDVKAIGPEGPAFAGGDKPVKALPEPPVATASGFFTHGRSSITYQDPKWVPKRINEEPAMIEADKDWWSGEFIINAEALAKSFTAVFDVDKIEQFGLDPARFFSTAIIDVELTRREILPGGKAGEERVIKVLPINPLRPPYPGPNAKEAEVNEYVSWSTVNQPEIIKPPFYQWLAGDPWREPGEATEQLVAAEAEARKAAKALDKEQQLLQAQQRRQALIQQQQQRRPGGFRGPAGIGNVMEDMEGMMDGEVGPTFVNPRVPYRPSPLIPRTPGRPVRPVRPGAAPAQPLAEIGAQLFDVAAIADIKIVAHDDTVEPGKTYRYRLRYRIFNPVHNSNAAEPKLSKPFAIESKTSDWTKPFKSRPKVEFFIAKINGQQADWEVYQFKDKKMNKSTVKAAPGDAIGISGWSVVDIGGIGAKSFSVIMNDAGLLARREPTADEDSDRRQQLKEDAELPPAQVGLR